MRSDRQGALPLRLLVIQHCPVTPVGLVGLYAADRGAKLETVMAHDGQDLPEDMRDHDGLIILGGPMHAGDDANYPVFARILELVRTSHSQSIPVLGLCLGAQLIARAFGSSVHRFGGLEVGYPPVALTEEGARDPLLRGLAREQRIMQMHEDSFDLPAEAVLLMRNETCANQAYRIGRTTYGIQAHPEVTKQDARNFPRDCWASMTRHYGDEASRIEAAVLAEVDAYFESGAAFCKIITERWLDLAAECRRVRAAELRPRRAV